MIENMTRKEKECLLIEASEKVRRMNARTIYSLYPETGQLSRHAYPKHMQFLEAGAIHKERCACFGNRTGKTWGLGGYELTLHLMGHYPKWWKGRRFEDPINAIASGVTGKETRDVIQRKLIGPIADIGTGLIPGDKIEKMTTKPGIPDAKDQVWVSHSSGGVSELSLMSFDQGREAFQGTERDVIWLDEEPPLDVYIECVMRTMTTDGIVMLTFTPLLGISEVVMLFMPEGEMTKDGLN